MEKYSNAQNYLSDQLWAIRPETLDAICEVLAMRASGMQFSKEELEARITGGPGRGSSSVVGSIAVIPLYGVIEQKINAMSAISGGTSVNAFMESFRGAVNDKTVSAIIIDVDSPGGSVFGIAEAANEIYAARGKKPIVAVADPTIASAAYWLACAANEIVCMPSGWVGSIGVLAVHRDFSKANEMAGVKPTYTTYGQYKAETNPDTPFSEDAQAYRQSQVDQMGDTFVKFVAKARGTSVDDVRKNYGQGRMLLAKDALALGMIDSIGTLDQTIARLSKSSMTAQGAVAELRAEDGGDEDEMSCACTCDEGCACGGTNDTCCGNANCDCCGMQAKHSAHKDLATVTNAALVGVGDVTTRWGDLVDRGLANGKQPGAVLTKAKNDALVQLSASLREAQATVTGIMQRAGVTEPKAETPEDSTIDTEPVFNAEFAKSRLEYLDRIVDSI